MQMGDIVIIKLHCGVVSKQMRGRLAIIETMYGIDVVVRLPHNDSHITQSVYNSDLEMVE